MVPEGSLFFAIYSVMISTAGVPFDDLLQSTAQLSNNRAMDRFRKAKHPAIRVQQVKGHCRSALGTLGKRTKKTKQGQMIWSLVDLM